MRIHTIQLENNPFNFELLPWLLRIGCIVNLKYKIKHFKGGNLTD